MSDFTIGTVQHRRCLESRLWRMRERNGSCDYVVTFHCIYCISEITLSLMSDSSRCLLLWGRRSTRTCTAPTDGSEERCAGEVATEVQIEDRERQEYLAEKKNPIRGGCISPMFANQGGESGRLACLSSCKGITSHRPQHLIPPPPPPPHATHTSLTPGSLQQTQISCSLLRPNPGSAPHPVCQDIIKTT